MIKTLAKWISKKNYLNYLEDIMKISTIKKSTAILLAITVILTGCNTGTSGAPEASKTPEAPATSETNNPPASNETEKFTIGISQIIQHPALDASRQGFIDEMETLGVKVEFFDQNAQGDINNAQMIAEKFVKDKVDLIFTIATPTSENG